MQAGSGVCAQHPSAVVAVHSLPPAPRPQDQRGTGLSTAITADNIMQHGTPEEQATHLSFFRCLPGHAGTGAAFTVHASTRLRNNAPLLRLRLDLRRADSIVADAEIIRSVLVPSTNHDGRWTILGQSFGGFCCVSYLSVAPESAWRTGCV